MIYELLKLDGFKINNGEIIFSWMILLAICFNLFIT